MNNSLRSLLVVIISFTATAAGANFSSSQTSSPRIDGISAPMLGRAGRLRIFGSNFGAIQSGSHVLIDGQPAPVSRWSDAVVVAYVPDTARIGPVAVQIVSKTASSNTVQLDVNGGDDPELGIMAAQANGSIKWRFEVDADYMGFRPTIGPDGTIYFQDVDGHLYALNPEGGVKWIFQGRYPAGPVAVGMDNTTYIASDSTIQAISPAGSLVWEFTDPDSQGVIAGPAVGPDGKVYAAMDLLGLGVIALDAADGHLVWSNPGDPRLAEYGQLGLELVFGPASPGGQPDQLYLTADNITTDVYGHLYAFSLNGDQRWAASLGGISQAPQVAVAPNGAINLGVAAFDPSNGSVLWSAYSELGSGSSLPPDVGPDGTVYVLAEYQSALAALNGHNGAVLWRITGVGFEQGPVVSPLNDVVVVGGRENYGLPGYFRAFTIGGESLWRIDLPGEPYPGMFEFPFERGRFSPDGTTVYMGTSISGEPEDNLHCFLYAIQTAAAVQNCSYSIDPISASFSSSGAEASLNVAAPNGCGWTAISNASWIGITSADSGSGNDVVNYVVRDNTTTSPRTGTISVAGKTFTLTQDGINICTFSISPKSKSFGKNGGTGTVNVTTSSGCGWTATSNASWITITSAAVANGDGVVSYSVSANNSKAARSGTLLLAGNTFTVKQKGR